MCVNTKQRMGDGLHVKFTKADIRKAQWRYATLMKTAYLIEEAGN